MTLRGPSTEEIKDRLIADLDRLVHELGIDGKWVRGWMLVSSPVRRDRNPSFGIRRSNGSFIDFAYRSEMSGSVIDLIGLVALGQMTKAARRDGRAASFAWARRFLGLDRPLSDAERQEFREKNARRVAESAARQQKDDEEKAKGAFALWLKCEPSLIGTLGEAYLQEARGIPLRSLARQPRAMRFHPALNYQHRFKRDGEWIEERGVYPAIVTAATDLQGRTRAVHRIYMAADGRDKAPVSKPRKVWGSIEGCAMRIWRGESGLSEREASEKGLWDRLAFVEGVEDGLALALACPELRIWAVSSLYNLAPQVLPDCCGELIVCQDNDWDKPEAVAEFERAIEALDRQARPRRIKVSVARSSVGKDVNDLLRS